MLQYGDDTVILLEKTDSNILLMKFHLYCFENMSGMKINYHKSEVYVLEVDTGEQERVSNLFNRKLGQLYMLYLGVPIGIHILNQFMFVGGSCACRQQWKNSQIPA